MINIDVICPIFNSEKYIKSLYYSIKTQKGIIINNIYFLYSESSDNSEKILKSLNDKTVEIIYVQSFSHSLTRESILLSTKSKIAIMLSHDVKLINEDSFMNLVKNISLNKSHFSYGMQRADKKSIELYIREYNYPVVNEFRSKMNSNLNNINTFFCSDAFSAYNTDVFKKLNGYDGLDLPTNEDMYYAKKIIDNNYTLEYVANACVIHYHNYTLKDLYHRYLLTGMFIEQNLEFKTLESNGVAIKMFIFVLKKSLKNLDLKSLFNIFPNFLARYLGKKKGSSIIKKRMKK